MAIPFLLIGSSFLQLCLGGQLYTSPDQVTKKYDFIVVGAGTAGSVVAARLSEEPSVQVLVIEAGVSDNGTDSDIIYVPLLVGTGVGTILDWNYTTVAQSGLNGRTIDFPRGFVLGGSSCINGMIYSRGGSDEYDRLATVSGDSGWSWKELQQWNEHHTPPWNDRRNIGEYNPLVHGFGPLATGLTPTVFETEQRVFQMTDNRPELYPFNLDPNSTNGLGFSWFHTTVGTNARSTSGLAYLHPALNSCSNLDVLIHTQVTKLIEMETNTYTGVQVAQSATAKHFLFTASKEVILSAGTIGTPQLLMLSGIGPAAELSKVDISCVHDVPDVGCNLQDQNILAIQWEVSSPTLLMFLSNETALRAALAQYAGNKTGIAAGNTVRVVDHPDNWELDVRLNCPTVAHIPNPFDHPVIDPAYLQTSFDIDTYVAAIKTLQTLMSTPAWDGFLLTPFTDVANLATDALIEGYVRKFASTLKHPTSTATISKSTDKGGVVGPDLLVKGLKGLRIVDASILPSAVAGFPQAEIYILAERAAALIKSSRL
ncbi:Aryl-alcohol oxidase-like protein [Mycena sanguinolenta]|uniref:Aryl-alcohol oxidase-like protein n=1 Tax=Mycena sanguinolenta TaxID=230812 RepID=A0A8H7CFY8_9AGAR|nr:Aryl-alcohol oxidase-like protein [Mycena sanguinolenta]